MSDITDSIIKLMQNRINGVGLSDSYIPTQNEKNFDNLMGKYNTNLARAIGSNNNESRQAEKAYPIMAHMWNAFEPGSKYDEPLGPTRRWYTDTSDGYDKAYAKFRNSFNEDEPLTGSRWINDKANIAQMQNLYDIITTPEPKFNSK